MKYFTFRELIRSDTAAKAGIDNLPHSIEIIDNLATLGDTVLDPLRAAMGFPVIITSGYRCPALNRAVGGVANSRHLTGRAADINCGLRRNRLIYDWLLAQQTSHALPIKELLWESNGAWVHVGI